MLDELTADLLKSGLDVLRFQPRTASTQWWIQARFARVTGPRFAEFAGSYPRAGDVVQKLVKAAILSTRPSRWDYFFQWVRDPTRGMPSELRRLVRRLPNRRVYLLSHSFGGVVSALVASEQSVRGVLCFGYPFKHPLRDEEPYRTASLAHVTKPFLIVQGQRDEYGGPEAANRYTLSTSVVVKPVSATHDYNDLMPAEYRMVLQALLGMIIDTTLVADQAGN